MRNEHSKWKGHNEQRIRSKRENSEYEGLKEGQDGWHAECEDEGSTNSLEMYIRIRFCKNL